MSLEYAITKNVNVFDPADGVYGTNSVLDEYKISSRAKRSLVIQGDPLVYDHKEKKAVSVLDGMGMRISAEKLEFIGISPQSFYISNALVACINAGECEIINNSPFAIVVGTHVTFVLPSIISCVENEKVQVFPLETRRAQSYCRFIVDRELDRRDPLLYKLSEESLRLHGDVLQLSFGDPILIPVREDFEPLVEEEEIKRSIEYYSRKFESRVSAENIVMFDLSLNKRRKAVCISHAIATSTALPSQPLRLLIHP